MFVFDGFVFCGWLSSWFGNCLFGFGSVCDGCLCNVFNCLWWVFFVFVNDELGIGMYVELCDVGYLVDWLWRSECLGVC